MLVLYHIICIIVILIANNFCIFILKKTAFIIYLRSFIKFGVQEAKPELLLKQFVIKLKSEEMAQIVYMIDLINKKAA